MTTRTLARQILALRQHGIAFSSERRNLENRAFYAKGHKLEKDLQELRNQDWRSKPSWMEGQ